MLILSVCCFLACLLLRSAWAKWRQPARFWVILRHYPGGTWFQTPCQARLVPAAEISLALGLVWGGSVTAVALLGALVFIGVGTVGIAWRLYHGETQFACGCGGNLEAEDSALVSCTRNLCLLTMGMVTLLRLMATQAVVRLQPGDVAAGVALLLAQELLMAAIVQEGRIRKWKAAGSPHT